MIPKFRAWNKDNKVMVEVRGINYDYEGVWSKEMIDDESDGGYLPFSDIELMQYTGVKDKHGKEVYIGDIVYDGIMKDYSVIKFEEDVLIVKWGDGYYDYLSEVIERLEVIGNIYESKELLEEER
ncbi:YopX family protein [Staphylococcus felis]|uniref:YopX family protein n=1 Tax=Staphylococcus felis TaxID=46127 RepID=UPI003F4366C6